VLILNLVTKVQEIVGRNYFTAKTIYTAHFFTVKAQHRLDKTIPRIMATDFSISTLLNLPSKESNNGSEQKIKVEPPNSKAQQFLPPASQMDSNGKN
jgi:hypothetical protein